MPVQKVASRNLQDGGNSLLQDLRFGPFIYDYQGLSSDEIPMEASGNFKLNSYD